MRLAKGIKFNIIIAILLCMAFVLNAGYTLAAATYSLNVTSVGKSQTETYTGFASMQGESTGYSASYTYSVGSVNNSIKLDYGFSDKYDVAVKFVATYTNGSHLAKDFSLNIVNRDMWCIDMPTVADLNNAGKSYYGLASSSNTLEGVMYYMRTLEGTGALPIISGVTFYTSGNNTYLYEGDELTITVTPIYTKSNGTYDSTHKFYTTSVFYNNDKTAINNWATYMTAYTANKTTVGETKYMYYNAYSTEETALEYPTDNLTWNGENLVMPTSTLERSNTAYRYKVVRTNAGTEEDPIYSYTTSYDNVIAGNKYYGGLGVYIIPNSSLVTVDISFNYDWYDCTSHKIITGDVNPISYKFSNEITNIDTAYYYSCTITEPTYIDVLEYMMLTASSGFKTALQNGYKVVLYNFTAEAHTSSPAANWPSKPTTNYEINNSSIQSGILVRQKDWAGGSTHIETDVSIHNYSDTDLAISSFTVKGTLWYSDYGDQSAFSEQPTGTYLQEIRTGGGDLLYRGVNVDENMWTPSYNPTTHVYTFTRNSGVNYIPSGSAITLISGVSVAEQSYPSADKYQTVNGVTSASIHDYWCTLEITVTTTNSTYSTQSSYTDLEVDTNGYYSQITSSSPAYIYVRNNTNQNITSVTLASMQLYALKSTDKPLRDHINTGTSVGYTVTNYITGNNATTATINLRPNEKILLFEIKPASSAIIYSYKISAAVEAGKVDNRAELTVNNETGDANIINTSTENKLYEFRLKSTTSFSAKLVNSGDFVCNTTASGGMYYAYYKGVILPGQLIKALTGVTGTINLQIDVIVHTQGWNAEHYVSSNYSQWNTDTSGAFANWLTAMQSIYGELA